MQKMSSSSTSTKSTNSFFSIDALMATSSTATRPLLNTNNMVPLIPFSSSSSSATVKPTTNHDSLRSVKQLHATTTEPNATRTFVSKKRRDPAATPTATTTTTTAEPRNKKLRRISSSSSVCSSLAAAAAGGDDDDKQQPPCDTPDTTTSDSGGGGNAANDDDNYEDDDADSGEQRQQDNSARCEGAATGSTQRGGGGGGKQRGGDNSAGGISPAQLNVGTSTCYELIGVQCHLEMRELWQKFNELGTEMIITRSGRRMFPTIRVAFTGLDTKATYAIYMDIVPVDQKRYRYAYHRSSWLVAGKAEATPPSRLYAHPDGPMCGEQLRKQVISFEKVKLTNFTCDKNGHVLGPLLHGAVREGQVMLTILEAQPRQLAAATDEETTRVP